MTSTGVTPDRPTIVVGVDGSTESNEALLWAASEARARPVLLHVILAWQGRPMSSLGEDSPDELVAHRQQLAEAKLSGVLENLGSTLQGIDVRSSAIEGPTTKVLGDASRSATLLVLGTRGHGRVSSLVLGSVSRQMTVQSACPVVVVQSDRVRRGLAAERKLRRGA